jgi:hypothetical protein
MIDLTKKGLPNVVEINGKSYSINTDFRVWMRFANEVKRFRKGEYIEVSYLFKEDMPGYCDLNVLTQFCFPKSELPRKKGHSKEILFDYEIDGAYIYAAFMSQYGIDLIEIEELHWYKFLAMFKGLKDDEIISKIMGYRGYEKPDPKKDRFAELKEEWRIEYISPEEQAEIDEFNNMFK